MRLYLLRKEMNPVSRGFDGNLLRRPDGSVTRAFMSNPVGIVGEQVLLIGVEETNLRSVTDAKVLLAEQYILLMPRQLAFRMVQ